MLNRTADLYVHGPKGIAVLFEPQLKFFCEHLPFKVFFEEFDASKHAVIYEDRSVTVMSIPLKHRVPCAGFLFEEKPCDRHILREMIDFYQIPYAQIPKIKQGSDYVTVEGDLILNHLLTTPAGPTVRYAYCSDTTYSEKIVPMIAGVDLLYHEATFAEAEKIRAKQTMHSTAAQAATIAKLANVKKLLLGHFSARYYNNLQILTNEARQIFHTAELAQDMQVYLFF